MESCAINNDKGKRKSFLKFKVSEKNFNSHFKGFAWVFNTHPFGFIKNTLLLNYLLSITGNFQVCTR
jgi:hypothetical protein